MFQTLIRRSCKPIAAVVAPVALALGILGMSISPASADVTFGPTGQGTTFGIAGCDAVRHQIGIAYTGTPEYQYQGSSLLSISTSGSQVAVPEWLDVWAYVKPSSGTWVPVAHGTAYVDHPGTPVINTTVSEYPGYYNVGFMVRVAYPGGTWSNWTFDWAHLQESYSGSVFASSTYCWV